MNRTDSLNDFNSPQEDLNTNLNIPEHALDDNFVSEPNLKSKKKKKTVAMSKENTDTSDIEELLADVILSDDSTKDPYANTKKKSRRAPKQPGKIHILNIIPSDIHIS